MSTQLLKTHYLKPGDTLHIKKLTQHQLVVLIPHKNGIRDITRLVARAIPLQLNRKEDAIILKGANYSKALHLTESLSSTLFGHADALNHETL